MVNQIYLAYSDAFPQTTSPKITHACAFQIQMLCVKPESQPAGHDGARIVKVTYVISTTAAVKFYAKYMCTCPVLESMISSM